MKEPSIALVEFRSIPRGIKSADAMVKKAPVLLLEAKTVCPGKYIVLIGGEVGPVQESYNAGVEVGEHMVVDKLFLPNVDLQVIPAIQACTDIQDINALGIIETFSVASAIVAADTAVKAAKVELMEIRLANGLGGKSFFTLTGEIAEVEAGIEAALATLKDTASLVDYSVIPAPHKDLNLKLL
ncbi:MAG: BMC domain-containing protein [Nitrospinae bacterium]|nr:BMC domain-containing protein [Nitrospinota bacterium]